MSKIHVDNDTHLQQLYKECVEGVEKKFDRAVVHKLDALLSPLKFVRASQNPGTVYYRRGDLELSINYCGDTSIRGSLFWGYISDKEFDAIYIGWDRGKARQTLQEFVDELKKKEKRLPVWAQSAVD